MKSNLHNKAKILTILPLIVFVIILFSFLMAYTITSRTNPLLELFDMLALAGTLFAPIPCLIMSILGTKAASKAVKEGQIETKKYFILGILDIIASVILLLGCFWVLYYFGSHF